MKKLMVAVAVALAAVASQSAQIKWSSDAIYGVNTATVGDNGVYGANGVQIGKNNSALTFVMTFYESGTLNVAGTWSGEMKYKSTSPKGINLSWPDGGDNTLKQGTTYDYIVTVTGTQNDLVALGTKGGFVYDNAIITGTASGTFTTESTGLTEISKGFDSWTVSGVVAQSVPEPTSGLLLLLGMAGLALRRRRA